MIENSNNGIPTGWQLVTLKDACLKIQDGNYGGQYPKREEFIESGIPFLTSKAIGGEGEIIEQKLDFISEEKHVLLKKAQLKLHDVLFTNRGANVGTIGLVDHRIAHGNIGPQLTLLRSNSKRIYYLYLKNVMKSFYVQSQVRSQDSGSAMNFFGIGATSKFKIPLPPLPEQRAIAKVLGSMDKAINANNQLIAQKELRKKWLMQNLLTGKKRLKGFSGEWKEVHISDVSKEISLRNKEDKQLTVLSCTKYDGLVPSLEYFGRKIYSDDLSTYKIVQKNHFAYATNHIEEGSIGYNEELDEALISPMYTIFKTEKSVNDVFFFKLLKSHRLIYEYNARMEGSIDRRGGLRWSAFSIIKIKLPSFEEQTAIAQILQAVDKELTLLKAKTDKLKEQKKGMMQVLLTGKKRLNQDL
jgi:type I restriction enzyme S subunit